MKLNFIASFTPSLLGKPESHLAGSGKFLLRMRVRWLTDI